MKIHILSFFILLSTGLCAQTSIPVGSRGSYASFPLASENAAAFMNSVINVPAGNTKPVPTNDWWSHVLLNNYAGNIWAYPVIINPENYGCQLIFPITWGGQDMVGNYPINIKGTGFAPAKNIAKTWSDWAVTINMQDGAKYMDITMGNGFPMAWFEISGFDPFIEFGTGATFFKPDGTAAVFPYTSNNIGVLSQGKYYGIYAPDNTLFSLSGTTLTMKNPGTKTYFTVATLNAKTDLAYFNTFAYSIPRDTKVSWNYQPEKATIDVTWTITTDNLKGASEKRVIQGFIPHHYKNCVQGFAFKGNQYATPRGLLKCAEGNSFSFTYNFNGVLGNTPVPTVQAVANPYDPAKMKTMVDVFAPTTDYGDDTYWGGKDLVNLAKYALIAKETGNSNYSSIKLNTRIALSDWYTYDPDDDEDAHYFARYDTWKALIGFNSSYGSSEFTDNHFHYGYFSYATALLGTVDQDFLTKYGPMAKQVVKQYANWDRTDTEYPFLRTFSPWRGHSYAGGTSSDNGNNQESSSESMQAWAGMFLLGDVLGDNAMRDAGAFGYLSESRATREYWFDVDNENFPASYPHSLAGRVFDGGMSYATWFSGDPLFTHGMQWLPWAPIMNYMAEYPAYLKADYEVMKADQLVVHPEDTDESEYGADWANVALCFEQMYDPAYTAKRFDEYWAAPLESNKNKVVKSVTCGQTYYYMHSHRTMGDIQWNCHTSAPNSQVYYNAATGKYTYTGYNSKSTSATITVYKNAVAQGTITVPAYSYFNKQTLDNITTDVDLQAVQEYVTIYPNPSNESFSLRLSDDLKDEIKTIEVYNSMGALIEVIKIKDGEEIIIIGNNYTPGTYMLKITGNSALKNYKVIKL